MKLVITTDDLSELHFEGKPEEIFESAKRVFIKICPEEMDKPFTIQDLADGKCAVENNGTLEQLTKVLNMAFPNDKCIIEYGFKFYLANSYSKAIWNWVDTTTLPTQSVADFLQDEFVWGEEVEVLYQNGDWIKRIFIAKSALTQNFICENDVFYTVGSWTTIRKLPTKTKLTKQEIADKFGVKVDNLEIV